MKNRLLLLDLVLLALVVVLGMRLRQNWLEARKRADIVLGRPVPRLATPPHSPLPAVEPVTAAQYGVIAQQTLFSSDRNPTVIVEIAPPKPMPALPVLYGVMDLGNGPVAIMSEKSGADQREVRSGGTIGEFKLVAVSGPNIVLEWDGQKVSRRVAELMEKAVAPRPEAGGQPPRPAAAPPPASVTSTNVSGPGADAGGGIKVCQIGDNSPAGAVVDGYRKTFIDTPFGKSCRWEAVK